MTYDLIINGHGYAYPMKEGFHEQTANLVSSTYYNPDNYTSIKAANGITYRVSIHDVDKPAIQKFFKGIERKNTKN